MNESDHPAIQEPTATVRQASQRLDLIERSNDQWIGDLRRPGPEQDAALADLHALLGLGLRFGTAKYPTVSEADLEGFAQEALAEIHTRLDSYRGRSRFTIWALKLAVHVAFTRVRQRRGRAKALA